jgi:hypothetical protein
MNFTHQCFISEVALGNEFNRRPTVRTVDGYIETPDASVAQRRITLLCASELP